MDPLNQLITNGGMGVVVIMTALFAWALFEAAGQESEANRRRSAPRPGSPTMFRVLGGICLLACIASSAILGA